MKHTAIKPPAVGLMAAIALSFTLGACGDAAKQTTANSANRGASGQQSSQHFLGDGDYDVGDGDWDNTRDTDKDAPFDYYNRKNYSWNRGIFHDRDDAEELSYGKAADSAEAQSITRVVEHYYRLASKDDGRHACPMLLGIVARHAAEYRYMGLPYLRGSHTCTTSLTRMFRHDHLTVPQVTSVRIQGNAAIALWGSRTMLAGYMMLVRRHRTWAIAAPVGNPLL